MKKFTLLLLTLLSVNSLVVYSQENKAKNEDVSKLIDVWLAAQKDYKDIPFISGVVVKDQQILWSGAFGNVNYKSSVPSNENTLSSIYPLPFKLEDFSGNGYI